MSHIVLISDVRSLLGEAGEWRMHAFSRDAIYKGLFGMASIGLATILSAGLATLTDTTTLMFYVAAVVATALYAGPKAALLAFVVSVPVAIYFVISNSHEFVIPESNDAVRLVVYTLVSLLIVVLAHMRGRVDEKYRRVERQLALARAELSRIEYCSTVPPTAAQPMESHRVSSAGGLEIDLEGRMAFRNGSPIRLTRTEWSILEHLASNAGKVLTNRELERYAFGVERSDRTQHLRNCVLRLRRKVEVDSSNPQAIVTVHGFGYTLQLRPEPSTTVEIGAVTEPGTLAATN